MKYLLFLICLCSAAQATVITAADGTRAEVQRVHDLITTVDSDTIIIPSGKWSYSAPLNITKGIILSGETFSNNGTSGYKGAQSDDVCSTQIVDDNQTPGISARPVLYFNIPAGKGARMTKLEVQRRMTAVTGNASTNLITAAEDHSMLVNQPIIFSSASTIDPDDVALAGGSGITAGTVYYIKTVPSATTFTISSSIGGAELDFTTNITAGTFTRGGKDQSVSNMDRGIIRVSGNTTAFRIDHCTFRNLQSEMVEWTDAKGIIDNCNVVADETFSGGVYRFLKPAISGYGDSDWINPINWLGDRNGITIEDCTFTRHTTSGSQYIKMMDCIYGGGRVTVRNCKFNKIGLGNHGTETSGRYRGGRMIEAYNNEFDLEFTTSATVDAGVDMRSGTAINWGNDYTGTFNNVIKLNSYRVSESNRPWLQADGTKEWDVPDLSDPGGTAGDVTAGDGIFESGTTSTTNLLRYADTAGITVSQSGTTVTATAPIFTAGMVGKGLRRPGLTFTGYNITGFTSSTVVTVFSSATVGASSFQVEGYDTVTDLTKSWPTPNQWQGYTVRLKTPTFTATSAVGTTSVDVSGSGWLNSQWAGWELTRLSDNAKTVIGSNDGDTLTFNSVEVYKPTFTAGQQFYLSYAGYISSSSTGGVLTCAAGAGQGTHRGFPGGFAYEIRRVDGLLDDPGRGATTAFAEGAIFNVRNQSIGQTWNDACYIFNDRKRATSVGSWGSIHVGAGGYPSIDRGRNYFDDIGTTYTGALTAGVALGKSGPIASRPTSGMTAGVFYWADNEGEWNSLNGSDPDGQLYVATGPTTWALYYRPYTYPHPLTVEGADVTPPTLASIVVNGATATWNFTESVTGVSAAHYAMSGGLSLSTASGSGATYTMTISPPATYGATYTASYTAGTTVDAAANPLASFSGATVINSTPNPGTPATRTPGRRPAAGRF